MALSYYCTFSTNCDVTGHGPLISHHSFTRTSRCLSTQITVQRDIKHTRKTENVRPRIEFFSPLPINACFYSGDASFGVHIMY
jgi:hypothetical protein